MSEINFDTYMSGKVKLDKVCDFLVEDIKNNKKDDFLYKWSFFTKKFSQIETLNISKVWSALIKEEKTQWLDILPFNRYCHAVRYSSKKYYENNSLENKKIFLNCVKEMSNFGKSNILKELEGLRLAIVPSFYEKNEDKCHQYLKVILELDKIYRSFNPQNPDKFLTYMIISQGKEIQIYNYNEPLSSNVFFNEVTVKLMDKLIIEDSIGANKLNNKKDSQSLNDIYYYFQKYYKYHKFQNMLSNLPQKNIQDKKNKI